MRQYEYYTEGGAAHAPMPVVGACEKKGEWKNENMVDKCLQCFKRIRADGKLQNTGDNFFCDGRCLNKYEAKGGNCSLNSLVALNKAQCYSPCVQTAAPSVGTTGKNKLGDKVLINKEKYGDYDYALDMYSAKQGWDRPDKLNVGVL